MRLLPVSLLQWLADIGFWKRPAYFTSTVTEEPEHTSFEHGLVYEEVRGGFPKWAYLSCPKCKEIITLPVAAGAKWTLRSDWLSRPTISPSIWQTGTCGAHFFIRKGEVDWCSEVRGPLNRLIQ